jgi:hypothetical protein
MEILSRATYGLNHQSEVAAQELVPIATCFQVGIFLLLFASFFPNHIDL